MKVLFSTERVPARSKEMSPAGWTGRVRQGVAWFELVLHEGPRDEENWEGGGQTIAYWRENFARMQNPNPWTVSAGMEGVAPAVIPDEVLNGFPDTARVSLLWMFSDREHETKSAS